MYNIILTRQAVKDAQKLEQAGFKPKTNYTTSAGLSGFAK